MTKQETAKLIMMVKATYPNSFKETGSDLLEAMVNAWTMLLAEYDYRSVEAAFFAYSKQDTKGYPPAPGQLIEQITAANEEGEASDEEAWAMVTKAIRNGCYGAKEEFAKLPPLLQKAVGSHENIEAWAMMDSERVHTVIHSQVLRSYRSERDRARTDNKVPEKIRRLMQSALDALEDKDA